MDSNKRAGRAIYLSNINKSIGVIVFYKDFSILYQKIDGFITYL